MNTDSFWKGKRALITGLSGFIGCWMAKRLMECGAEVLGYDKAAVGCLPLHEGLAEKLEIVKGDIADAEALAQVLREKRIDTCFHLAGQSMIEVGQSSPVRTWEINVKGTWQVLEACRLVPSVVRIAVASSNTVYGEQESRPFLETAPLNGSNPYAASKVCTDIIARSYHKTYGLPIAIIRQTNSFGGADPHLTHIVPNTMLSLLRGERPVLRSDGSPIKGYIYVEDTVEGYLAAAQRLDSPKVRGEAFNICLDEPVSVLDLVKKIVQAAGREDQMPSVLSTGQFYKEHERLSNQKAKEVLGWRPRYSLEEGLKKTWDWYSKHHQSVQLAAAHF